MRHRWLRDAAPLATGCGTVAAELPYARLADDTAALPVHCTGSGEGPDGHWPEAGNLPISLLARNRVSQRPSLAAQHLLEMWARRYGEPLTFPRIGRPQNVLPYRRLPRRDKMEKENVLGPRPGIDSPPAARQVGVARIPALSSAAPRRLFRAK
eukprot:gene12939-biopygen6082